MATITVSNEIAAPVDRVFQTFIDFKHGSDRVSSIKKLELMTTGPIRVGTRWLETREVMGRLDTAQMEINAIAGRVERVLSHDLADLMRSMTADGGAATTGHGREGGR